MALNNENGTFQGPTLVVKDFAYNQGWRVDQHPRFVADLTSEGRADIAVPVTRVALGLEWFPVSP